MTEYEEKQGTPYDNDSQKGSIKLRQKYVDPILSTKFLQEQQQLNEEVMKKDGKIDFFASETKVFPNHNISDEKISYKNKSSNEDNPVNNNNIDKVEFKVQPKMAQGSDFAENVVSLVNNQQSDNIQSSNESIEHKPTDIASEFLDQAKVKAKNTKQRASEIYDHTREVIKEGVEAALEKGSQLMHNITESAAQAYTHVNVTADELPENEQVRAEVAEVGTNAMKGQNKTSHEDLKGQGDKHVCQCSQSKCGCNRTNGICNCNHAHCTCNGL